MLPINYSFRRKVKIASMIMNLTKNDSTKNIHLKKNTEFLPKHEQI